jgi:excisionase family DNA binding protein
VDYRQIKEELPAVLTVKEAAEFLRVNPKLIYELAAAGEIGSAKIRRTVRIYRDDFLKWLESTDRQKEIEKERARVRAIFCR